MTPVPLVSAPMMAPPTHAAHTIVRRHGCAAVRVLAREHHTATTEESKRHDSKNFLNHSPVPPCQKIPKPAPSTPKANPSQYLFDKGPGGSRTKADCSASEPLSDCRSHR